jgi:small conductance mechanosensitive channel
MEPLDISTAEVVAAAESAWDYVSAIAIAYALSIVGALVLLFVGYLVAGWLSRWVYVAMGRVRGFDETLRRFFSKVTRIGVLILVGVTVLAQFGVQTASIIAALGAVGLAIGLALQGTLQNIAAGIMLLVLRPFRAGEYIQAGEVTGTIVEIGLFATELKTFDGLFVLAPNSELWKTPITNYTRNPYRLFDLTIGIGYDDDIDLARGTLLRLAEEDQRVVAEPAATTFVSTLGDSAVNVTLRYWTNTADWWQTKLDLTQAAKLAFDEKGISIPYPQQEVHYVPAEAEEAARSRRVESQ